MGTGWHTGSMLGSRCLLYWLGYGNRFFIEQDEGHIVLLALDDLSHLRGVNPESDPTGLAILITFTYYFPLSVVQSSGHIVFMDFSHSNYFVMAAMRAFTTS